LAKRSILRCRICADMRARPEPAMETTRSSKGTGCHRYGSLGRPCLLAGLLASSVQGVVGMPLLGEYGFLTQFDGITEAEARARVHRMRELFGILEFQFYDAVQGYSRPPAPELECWNSSFQKPVRRSILRAYTEEIRRIGGRSWLYVNAMATDPHDYQMQQGFGVAGQHIVDGRPLLDIIFTNAAWADRVAPQWAGLATGLGFAGIHWDTFGELRPGLTGGLPDFLRAAHNHLRARKLVQTCNFVDGAGWQEQLYTAASLRTSVVSFPYWEVWKVPVVEDRFFHGLGSWGGGVFACYPGTSPSHSGERQNTNAVGVPPLELLIKRWRKARWHGAAYLAIGDGARHIQTEYFPNTASITDDDITKIRSNIFNGFFRFV